MDVQLPGIRQRGNVLFLFPFMLPWPDVKGQIHSFGAPLQEGEASCVGSSLGIVLSSLQPSYPPRMLPPAERRAQ